MLECRVALGKDEPSCYALRAVEYSRYYRNIPAESFVDEYDRALTSDGQRVAQLVTVWDGELLVGTCRLVLARDQHFAELNSEIETLTTLTWPVVGQCVGIGADALIAMELGKFAVAADCDCRRVKWLLLTEVGRLARERGAHVVIALMPLLVERAARHAGVKFHRLAGCTLRRETSKTNRYLLRYRDYFLPTLAKRQHDSDSIDLDADDLDTLDLDAADSGVLRKHVSGVPDGPIVWWIRSDELANSPYPGVPSP